METKKYKRKFKGIVAIFLMSILIATMSSTAVFANANENDGKNEIERDFIIDTSANKPKEIESEFKIDVNKPNITSKTKQSMVVDVNKPKKKIKGYNPYIPTKPSKARGTLTESVGSDNKPYPVRDKIKDGAESIENKGQLKERPKADSREFLTFETKNGKVFHLIIDRDEKDTNVMLLTEVSEQDLLNMIVQEEEAKGISKPEEKPKKELVKKEEPKKQEPKKEENSMGSFLILIIIATLVGAGGYYIKVIKPREDNLDDFEDDEVPNDDYFDDGNVEEKTETEEDDEESPYKKEDLV